MQPWVIDEPDIDPAPLMGEFQTGLWYPRYSSGEWGQWTVKIIRMAGARGYWGKLYKLYGTVLLLGPSDSGQSTWMSMTPCEIESQTVGLTGAHGHTVVLGMGMGWLAANAALKPEVERVTIVERDTDVIELIEAQKLFAQLPPEVQDKVTVVQGDAMEWRPDSKVDTVQADIWLSIMEDDKCAEMQRMQRNIGADSVYFWGQEMELWRMACRRFDAQPDRMEKAMWDELAGELDLPLITGDWPDYGRNIAEGAVWWCGSHPGWWRKEETAVA